MSGAGAGNTCVVCGSVFSATGRAAKRKVCYSASCMRRRDLDKRARNKRRARAKNPRLTTCDGCGADFTPTGRQRYCGTDGRCTLVGRKRAARFARSAMRRVEHLTDLDIKKLRADLAHELRRRRERQRDFGD